MLVIAITSEIVYNTRQILLLQVPLHSSCSIKLCTCAWYYSLSIVVMEYIIHLMYAGVTITTCSQDVVCCKVCVIACSVDIVAKAPLLNMNQFNGYFGCPKCLQKGMTDHLGSFV